MADDNVHWLRDTYGPALRSYYAELLRAPVPQRFTDLLARLEAEAALAEGNAPAQVGTGQGAGHGILAQPQEPVDASD